MPHTASHSNPQSSAVQECRRPSRGKRHQRVHPGKYHQAPIHSVANIGIMKEGLCSFQTFDDAQLKLQVMRLHFKSLVRILLAFPLNAMHAITDLAKPVTSTRTGGRWVPESALSATASSPHPQPILWGQGRKSGGQLKMELVLGRGGGCQRGKQLTSRRSPLELPAPSG